MVPGPAPILSHFALKPQALGLAATSQGFVVCVKALLTGCRESQAVLSS